LPAFTDALDIASEQHHKIWEAFTLYRLGFTQNRLFYYIDAYHSYEKALDLAESLNIPDVVTQTRIGMGELYINTGNYDQALRSFNQAISIAAKDDESILHAESLTHLAALNLHIGCLDDAREIARKVDEIIPGNTTLSTRIELDLIRAEIYYATGMKENAKILIGRVLDVAEKTGSIQGFIRANIQLAIMDIDTKKFQDALAVMQRIEKKSYRPVDIQVKIEQLIILSRIYLGLNRLQDSLNLLDRAVKSVVTTRIPRYIWAVYYNLGRVLNELQDHQKAKAAYETADTVLRETASSLSEPLRQTFMEQRERQMLYQHYILLLRKLNHKEEAIRVLENVNSPALQRRVGHLFSD
jgi:tetratricopeptide (TPR) repeat protein